MLKATDDNLRSDFVTEPVMRWLISTARDERTFTYSEMMGWLEGECGLEEIPPEHFSKLSRAGGVVLGAVMKNIHDVEDSAPFLNVLVVRKDTGRPGPGAREFLAERYPDEHWLNRNDAYEYNRNDWIRIAKQETEVVCNYPDWERLYKEIYGSEYTSDRRCVAVAEEGSENDGLPRGRSGEGENHKALRLRVKNNPGLIGEWFHGVRAGTEVELRSGDRVDVVLYGKSGTIAIEVKSRDSNRADFERGIYQCVKYRAVLSAQDNRLPVESWLVTETELNGDLKALAKKLGIKHKIVSLT